jgi:hypothetical protein
MTTTMCGSTDSGSGVSGVSETGLASFSPALLGVLDAMVETGQIAHAHRRHQLVALVHLADTPVEGVGGLFHVDHHRGQQVRDALVDRQFEHLGVDQDQPHLVRLGLVEQRQDHRVDTDRLAGTGGTGDQQVRHLGQIDDHRLASRCPCRGSSPAATTCRDIPCWR